MDSADFDALEERARARLAPAAYAFAAAGADDEITTADNVAAWRRLRLRPRVLNDITRIDTRVSILGVRLETPIMVAPFGRHKTCKPKPGALLNLPYDCHPLMIHGSIFSLSLGKI